MGIYLRPAPLVKVRLTRRGLRRGPGPRARCFPAGAGGPVASAGAGPFSFCRPLRRRRRR
jgi:hypothetical protein